MFSFTSANTYKKDTVFNDYGVAFNSDKICSMSNCQFHILLLGNVQELLKKLDTFCFTYQQVDCLYTLFKYRFSGKVTAKSGHVFDNVQRAVDFNHRTKGVNRMPSIAKKRLLRQTFKRHFLAPFRRQKQRRLVDQCLQREMKNSKRLILKSWIATNKNCRLFSWRSWYLW